MNKIKVYFWPLLYIIIYFIMQFLFIKWQDEYLNSFGRVTLLSTGGIKSLIITKPQYALALGAFIAFIIFNIIFMIERKNIYAFCGFHKTKRANILAAVILGISLSLIIITITKFQIIYGIEEFIKLLLEGELLKNRIFIELILNTIKILLLSMLPVVLFLPFFEEVLFRGLILNELMEKINIYAVIVIQAVLFGALHMDLRQLVSAFFIGLILGILFIWSKSIWIPVVLHISINMTSTMLIQINDINIKTQLLFSEITYSTSEVISTYVKNTSKGLNGEIPIKSEISIWFRIVFIVICLTIITLCFLNLWKSRIKNTSIDIMEK